MYKGIDVSAYQGAIDWSKVKSSGVAYAIIRAGYGYYAGQVDKFFEENVRGAKSAGIKVGVYWFGYAVDEATAREEADFFAEVIKNYHFELGVFYDYEYESISYAKRRGYNLSKEQNTDIVIAFLEAMQKKGYKVGFYVNPDLISNAFDDRIKKYDTWIAHWDKYIGKELNLDEKYKLEGFKIIGWQYSNTGKVDGIGSDVDLDIFYEDYENITAENIEEKKVSAKFKKGDIVKVLNAVQYDNGQAFKCWHETYDVIQVSGDRIVIGKDNVITAAVHEDNITLASGSVTTKSKKDIKIGDTVKVLDAIQYDNGQAFKCWHETYDVIQVSGDRIVIGKDNVITAAVHKDNLEKV